MIEIIAYQTINATLHRLAYASKYSLRWPTYISMLTFRAFYCLSMPLAVHAYDLPPRIIIFTCNNSMISLSIHKCVRRGRWIGAAKFWGQNELNISNVSPFCRNGKRGTTQVLFDYIKLCHMQYVISLWFIVQSLTGKMQRYGMRYLGKQSQNMQICPHCLRCWQFVSQQSWKSLCTGACNVFLQRKLSPELHLPLRLCVHICCTCDLVFLVFSLSLNEMIITFKQLN